MGFLWGNHVNNAQWVPLQAVVRAHDEGYSNVQFEVADVGDADSVAESFDALLCSASLPYLWDVKAALYKFRNWLKPGGRLVFNTPQV